MELRVTTSELGAGLDALEAALRVERLPEATILELRLVAQERLPPLAETRPAERRGDSARGGPSLGPGDVILEFPADGRPFDPLAAPPPEFSAQAGERPIGGLGVHLV